MGISKPLSARNSRTRKVNVDGEFNSALNAYSWYKAMSLGMVKGYWVALADITDPEGYKAYIEENANAFRNAAEAFSLAAVHLRDPKVLPARVSL